MQRHSQGSAESVNQGIQNVASTWNERQQNTSHSNGLKFNEFKKYNFPLMILLLVVL